MLPDLLKPGLEVVFCGTAVGERSAERQLYYSGNRNKFWRTLHQVGLTPRQLEPAEYERLLDFGIGLTGLVKNMAGMDENLSVDDFEGARQRLVEQILKYRPHILCFNGKRAAKEYFGQRRIDYGLQEQFIEGTQVFVAPSTSGAAARWWDVSYWFGLSSFVS